ncbi:MAG TPA: extracellular solute-binding protein [Acidimicrobiales bacterium]|nr:extracellular solute-binding protein [Acidimicrobiales bacterium]
MPFELPKSIKSAEPLPAYFELKRLLMDAILRGELRPGDRLPTEHELCRHFSISRTPVRRALAELVEEGVVLRYRRSGSFVNPHWFRRKEGVSELRILVPEGPWERFLGAVAMSAGEPVSIVSVPWPELRQQVRRAVAEGQAPDVAVLDSVWTAELAEAGFLVPFDEISGNGFYPPAREDFFDNVLAAGTYDGHIYGWPAMANVAGLWYRRQPLEEVGARPPATWTELRDTLDRLRQAGRVTPFVMSAGPLGGETTTFSLLAFMASNAATVLDDGHVALAGRPTAETLAFLVDLVDRGLMDRDVVSLEWDDPIKLLARGETAVALAGSYDGAELAGALGVQVDGLWDQAGFVAVPGGPRGRPTGGVLGAMVYGVFRQSRNATRAAELIERATRPEPVAQIARATGEIPPRRSAVALARSPFVTETAAVLQEAVTRPITPWYPRVSNQLQLMLEAVLIGRLTPAVAAKRTAELIQAITGLPLAKPESARRHQR